MTDTEDVIARLTSKDAKDACSYAQSIAEESRASDRWYPYLDSFAALLQHDNSLVRNRAIAILAANARWDEQGRFDKYMDELLSHITDEKPITARQCIAALQEIARARPELSDRIRKALEDAEISHYRDSMQPLIRKDIAAALEAIKK